MALPHKEEPWLVQFHGERNQRSQTFYSMSQRSHHVESIPEIRSHRIAATSHGWLLLIWDCREYDHDCFLLNPATMEKIQLPDWPDLDSTYQNCILSSPPTAPDCVVLFTLSTDEETTFLYCKPGDDDWKRQQLHTRCSCEVERELEAEPLQFAAMTTFRGEINAIAYCCDTLFKVQINRVDDDGGGSCSLSIVDVNVTKPDALFHHYIRADVDSRIYMVESSSGELIMVEAIYGNGDSIDEEDPDRDTSMMTIELYTVNFERRVWEKVDALPEDCAIFIGASGDTILWYEIPREDLDAGLVRGNTIYFAQKNDRYLYSYNVQERSMTVSLPCPDVNWAHPEQQWILTHGWLSSPTEFSKPEVVASEAEAAAPASQGIALIDDSNVGDGWSGVPIDNLQGADCRCFHLDCEKCQFHDQLSNHRLPYLVHIGQDGELVNFYNPLTNATSISPLKGMNLTGAVIRCSKHGWLLMSQGSWGEQVFFFNPFTDERIDLPELGSYEFEGIAFSSPPTSSDCVVLGYSVGKQDLNLAYVCRGESRWRESVVERKGTQFMRSCANPVYHQGLFYLIGGTRSLCTFDPVERDAKLLELAGNDKHKSTVSIQGSYLLECNGKLLSVYTSRVGEVLRIYELNREAATWEGLDDTMLFLSSPSSLSTTSAGARISGLGNKVFLDRFREKDSVFYSLATRKFHSLWSRYENDDWCDTKEYMNCAWMEPNFGTHTEEELVWFDPVEEEEEEEEEKEEEEELASFHPAIVEE